MACKEKEEFAFYWISRLIDSEFGGKPQESRVLIPISATRSALAASLAPTLAPTPPVPALLASLSPILGPSDQVSANTSIYPIQPTGTGVIPGAYMQLSGISYTSAPHVTPTPYATHGDYMQSQAPTSAAYKPFPGIKPP